MSNSSLEQLKARSQFFKRGAIIPRRVLKCKVRNRQHNVRFGSDCWVLPGKQGYVVFFHNTPSNSAIYLCGKRQLDLNGSPYHADGITAWIGDFRLSPEKHLESIREWLFP